MLFIYTKIDINIKNKQIHKWDKVSIDRNDKIN